MLDKDEGSIDLIADDLIAEDYSIVNTSEFEDEEEGDDTKMGGDTKDEASSEASEYVDWDDLESDDVDEDDVDEDDVDEDDVDEDDVDGDELV
ncbi:hypothetical protein LTR17_003348 [Elasticomyces elasticus]|nr:hypothetical protein LTR17_003348 [Elasticomyces elasticus]